MIIMRIRQGIKRMSILRTSFFCLILYSRGSIVDMASSSSSVGGEIRAMVEVVRGDTDKRVWEEVN